MTGEEIGVTVAIVSMSTVAIILLAKTLKALTKNIGSSKAKTPPKVHTTAVWPERRKKVLSKEERDVIQAVKSVDMNRRWDD